MINIMNRIVILNTPEVPCAGTLLFHVKKLCEGFRWNGLDVVEVNTLDELNQIGLCEKDFIYISNHFINGTDYPTFYRSSVLLERLLNFIADKKCIPILWFWHAFIDDPLMKILGNRYILTGEHFRRKPTMPSHVFCWDIQNRSNNYVPSTFSAAIHPDKIGSFSRSNTFMSNFVGCSYKTEWLDLLSKRPNEKHHVIITPPHVPEKDRVSSFLNSVTSLGFHAQPNIDNSVVVERVFEGLAYGNVVVSDNPCCKEMTDGIIEFVDSYDSLVDLLHKAWYDIDYRTKKQSMGMEWCRQYGTYKPVASAFLKKAGEING